MIDFNRCRGIALVALGLLVALVLVDGMLTLVVGATSRWLPHGDYPADRSVLASGGGRIAGAAGELSRAREREKEHYGVLLGQSTLECGIDPYELDSKDGLPYRWLNLYGEGGSIHKIDDLAHLLFAIGPKPDLAVIAVNPYMLIGNNYKIIRDLELASSRNQIKPWVWTWENKTLVNYFVMSEVDELRIRSFKHFGLGPGALYPPALHPWQLPALKGQHMSDSQLASRLEYNRGLGWLDSKNYTTETSNALALASIIRDCRAHYVAVVMVQMPMRSLFRESLPPKSRECLRDIARLATPDRPVPIINLESEVPDDQFFDLDHLDDKGRVRCTQRLAKELSKVIGTTAAPSK